MLGMPEYRDCKPPYPIWLTLSDVSEVWCTQNQCKPTSCVADLVVRFRLYVTPESDDLEFPSPTGNFPFDGKSHVDVKCQREISRRDSNYRID